MVIRGEGAPFLAILNWLQNFSTSSLVLKARAFFCKMGPLIGWSSARFWRNHKHIAESNALLMLVFIDFREEQLLEVSTCNTNPVTTLYLKPSTHRSDRSCQVTSHQTTEVDLVQTALGKVLGRASLDEENLTESVLCGVEAIVNAHYVSYLSALTPSHFLTGRASSDAPYNSNHREPTTDVIGGLTQRWHYRKKLICGMFHVKGKFATIMCNFAKC
ncbi:hypothetical protein T01_301 [Trichinella spiralis]|uniref:Uncharacterized protein n=1 Tax=Trichinella spiralis TaxID=6334 RepID=A0A0V1AZL3_TRISP|nr:hypothetical protein T01_301 [Trichinella spiralis]